MNEEYMARFLSATLHSRLKTHLLFEELLHTERLQAIHYSSLSSQPADFGQHLQLCIILQILRTTQYRSLYLNYKSRIPS